MAKVKFSFSLPVSIIKEGREFIAYTPALDISTHAKSFETSKKRFSELVHIYLEELVEKGTLEPVLESFGWKKQQKQWYPPTLVAQESNSFQIPLSL